MSFFALLIALINVLRIIFGVLLGSLFIIAISLFPLEQQVSGLRPLKDEMSAKSTG